MLKVPLMALALAAVSIPGYLDAQSVTTSSVPYSTPNRGAFRIETASTTTVIGYARAQPTVSTTPTGVAIFDLRQNDILVSETGVPGVTTMTSGRTYAEVNSPFNTGVAFANPSSSSVVVSFTLTDQFGVQRIQSSFILNANAQIAKFLTEQPFNLTSGFIGNLTFNSSAPIAVIALRTVINERTEFLATTQSVASLPSDISAAPILLAHFADGAGWRTKVFLVNITDAAISGTVEFFGEGFASVPAAPLTLTVNGQTASSFSYTVPARGSATLETSSPASGVPQVGSIRITPIGGSNAPSAFAVLSFTLNGVMESEATVQAQPPGTALRSFVEVNSNQVVAKAIQSGIAIANNSSTAATVNIELLTIDGSSTGLNTSVTVPALGHVSRFVQQLFPSLNVSFEAPFRGMLRITSFSSIAVVAIRTQYNELGTFLMTTTPVSNEASTASTAELVFPQIVDGGGYTTQFILFSGIANQNTTGTLGFVAQDGRPLNLLVR
jgi:hypothetical protein